MNTETIQAHITTLNLWIRAARAAGRPTADLERRKDAWVREYLTVRGRTVRG